MSEEASLEEVIDDGPDGGEDKCQWHTVELSEISRKRSENVDPQEVDLDRHVGLEHIEPNTPYPNWEYVDGLSSMKRRFEPGDILFAKLRPNLEKAAQPDFEGVASTDIFPIVAEQGVNSKYLLYRLSSKPAFDHARRTSVGTRMPRTSWNLFGNYEFDLPPIEEQGKIAGVLYTVDQAIQKSEEIIEQTERIQKGLRQDLLTFGIDESGEIRTENQCQETYLGEMPEQWKVRRIDEVCSETVDCPHSTPEYTDEGILVVRTSEIEDGRFDPSGAPRVTEEGYKNRISRLEPQPGDVIFTREAPIGEAFKIPEGLKLCLGQRIMQLRPIDGVVDPDFLVELIYSDKMQSWFERSARGSTSKHVNVGDIESLKIPIPSFKEQKRIDSVLGDYREQIDTERVYLNRLQRFKQGLMQDLLSGEVRTHDRDIEIVDDVLQHG